MKLLLAALLLLTCCLIGCGSEDQSAPGTPAQSTQKMPGGVGITAGESGTGTTNGSSTGY